MQWAAIIQAILAVLGPILSDALKRWLDGKLKAAAKTADPDTLGDPVTASGDLLAAVLAATPRRQVFKRAFLRHAVESVPGALAAGKLNSADRKELGALAEKAGEE
jgi:hypothetical protein